MKSFSLPCQNSDVLIGDAEKLRCMGVTPNFKQRA